MPWHSDSSILLLKVIHTRYGSLGTVVASFAMNVLLVGVHWYLLHGVRWFRCNCDQHMFWHMHHELTDVGHRYMEMTTGDIVY